jgi:GxxExxY protein
MLLQSDETFRVRGAVFNVYRNMGTGFLEAVYHECLALEFARAEIPFRSTPLLSLTYLGTPLQQRYSPDFICFDDLIVEIKALRTIAPEHRAQVMNYLRATELKVGLLVNFGSTPGVQIERFAL